MLTSRCVHGTLESGRHPPGEGKQVNDTQLHIAIGAPLIFNALMVTILMAYVNAKIDGLRGEIAARFEAQMQALLRVEGVLDARLKSLEERYK
jgi:hypothetical protein